MIFDNITIVNWKATLTLVFILFSVLGWWTALSPWKLVNWVKLWHKIKLNLQNVCLKFWQSSTVIWSFRVLYVAYLKHSKFSNWYLKISQQENWYFPEFSSSGTYLPVECQVIVLFPTCDCWSCYLFRRWQFLLVWILTPIIFIHFLHLWYRKISYLESLWQILCLEISLYFNSQF